jgi:hypothetical protein
VKKESEVKDPLKAVTQHSNWAYSSTLFWLKSSYDFNLQVTDIRKNLLEEASILTLNKFCWREKIET